MYGKLSALALLSLAAIIGCSKSADSVANNTALTGQTGATAGDKTTVGAPSTPAPSTPAGALKDLKIEDIKTGKGPAPKGDTIWVLYTGHLTNFNGKAFDSTSEHGNKPFPVHVGGGEVIQGWDKGLVGMQVGTDRHLSIPSKLAYGDAGQGQQIPPGADLFFDVQAVALVKQGDEDLIDIKVLRPGSGATPKVGDKVTVAYVGKLPTGEEIDRSKGDGVSFVVGHQDANGAKAIPGLDFGVQQMKVGERAILTIPPRLGKPTGSETIPTNSVLIFDVTLKKIG